MLSSKPTTATPPPPPPPPDNHLSNNRKATDTDPQQQQQPPLKCPRCDSSNTKFCYYNNYSLSQPRHFCKTCRRYWTRGGALRNVPIGGGCRNNNNNKTKKVKTSNVSSSSTPDPSDFGFKFLPTASSTAGVYTHSSTHFVPPGSGHGFGLDLFGLNPNPGGSSTSSSGGGTHKIPISSIESLSSINQEMHWKLQQQRMALIYQGDHNHNPNHNHNYNHNHNGDGNNKEKEGCINLFENLEFSGKVDVGPSDWSFGIQSTNYATNSTTTAVTTVNHVSNINCDVNSEIETGTTTVDFTALQHDQHGVSLGAWTNNLNQFNGSV